MFAGIIMKWTNDQLWERFKRYHLEVAPLGLTLDISRMNFGEDFFSSMGTHLQRAFTAMAELEKGAIANPDEKRMVGHYWLRNPSLAPNAAIRAEIEQTLQRIHRFAAQVQQGTVRGINGAFKNLLLIGIGGSALGPQFVANALGSPATDKLKPWFFDNTDPDGIDRVLAALKGHLGQTLCLVISKSGGTKETRNGMLEAKAAYDRLKLPFEKHAVAITKAGSELDKTAANWLDRFPMWDWVGGRTSETSAVGLLPAILQGIDIDELLAGARACDEATRVYNVKVNPAAQLALMWYYSGNGKGQKDMVILPYKDRLELFSRYLQQLIMESLGKELALDGGVVHQGIAVYGNKGSTDQHAYVQQLRDGVHNFFVTFLEVLRDRQGDSMEVEPNVNSGDFLHGFLHGTRRALYENGRESITITIRELSPFTVGALIALYERTVGFYASLVNINAYHQPGVEAGKKAATDLITLKLKVLEALRESKDQAKTVEAIATDIGESSEVESVYKTLEHLAANPDRKVVKIPGQTPFTARYRIE
jgi:glucose-6-phosphate isomerase